MEEDKINVDADKKVNATTTKENKSILLKTIAIILGILLIVGVGMIINLKNTINEQDALLEDQGDVLGQCAYGLGFGIGLNERYQNLIRDLAISFEENSECREIIYPYINLSVEEVIAYTSTYDMKEME